MKLIGKIFLLFTLSTALELYLLLLLTNATSIWLTVALTIFSGMLGAYLLRREGLRAIAQIGAVFRLEKEPADAILDGAVVLVAAAFLITPGVLTDMAGLLLMLPIVRRPLVQYLKKRFQRSIEKQMQAGTLHIISNSMNSDPRRFSRSETGPVIDVEVER